MLYSWEATICNSLAAISLLVAVDFLFDFCNSFCYNEFDRFVGLLHRDQFTSNSKVHLYLQMLQQEEMNSVMFTYEQTTTSLVGKATKRDQ